MDDLRERLAVAGEDLRVADEELRAQQELIDGLLRARYAEQLAAVRLAAALPVPLLETDRDGLVLVANPAALALLQVDAEWLRGTPLTECVRPADQDAVGAALARAVAGDQVEHLTLTLTPRLGGEVVVDAVVLPAATASEPVQDPATAAARWVLAPRTDPGSAVDAALLAALGSLATVSAMDGDLQPALVRLAELAVQGIGPARAASVVIGPPAEPTSLVSTDQAAQNADGVQYRTAQGPSWDAYAGRQPVTAADLGTHPRWPALRGIDGGAVAVPMPDGRGDPVGVLILYGAPALADPRQVRHAVIFADAAVLLLREHATVALLRQQEAQLRDALTSRAVIDQAKGILMARQGLDADGAFAELARLSQHANVKLRDVARQLVVEVTSAGRTPARPTGT
jgi:ANTAR domain/PAS fold/GAF domain